MGSLLLPGSDLDLEWVGVGLSLGLLTSLGAAGPDAVLILTSRWRLSLSVKGGLLKSFAPYGGEP